MPSGPSEITDLLQQIDSGDSNAADRLLEVVYGELRTLAASYLRRERAGLTLETTGLVHEAYLRLVDQQRTSWKNRGHLHVVAGAPCGRRTRSWQRAAAHAERVTGNEFRFFLAAFAGPTSSIGQATANLNARFAGMQVQVLAR